MSMRILMIGLVLNLSWGPITIKNAMAQEMAPATPICQVPIEWSEIAPDWPPYSPSLATSQANAFNWLGWENYDICEDLFVLLDEEIVAADPSHSITGERGLEFTITTMHWQNVDWESYDLDAEIIADLQATDSTGAVVHGYINHNVEFEGITVSFDDPLGELPRTHALLIMDGVPDSSRVYALCEGDQQSYDECVGEAGDDLTTCKTVADNDFTTCCYKDGATGAGVGGFLGCVIGKLKRGGVGGAAGIKIILALCGLGALVGAAVEIYGCYLEFKNDKANCYVYFQNDLDDCRREHCRATPKDAEPF